MAGPLCITHLVFKGVGRASLREIQVDPKPDSLKDVDIGNFTILSLLLTNWFWVSSSSTFLGPFPGGIGSHFVGSTFGVVRFTCKIQGQFTHKVWLS